MQYNACRLGRSHRLGLLSEALEDDTGESWGNFPVLWRFRHQNPIEIREL